MNTDYGKNEQLIRYEDQDPIKMSSVTSFELNENSSYKNEDSDRIVFYLGTKEDKITWEFTCTNNGKNYQQEAKEVYDYLVNRFIEDISDLDKPEDIIPTPGILIEG